MASKPSRTARTAAWRNAPTMRPRPLADRKSTRLNSSHLGISYAVFCLKKKRAERVRLADGQLVGVDEAVLLARADHEKARRRRAELAERLEQVHLAERGGEQRLSPRLS